MTEVAFTINWMEVLKIVGSFILGVVVVILLIMWWFRDFRLY